MYHASLAASRSAWSSSGRARTWEQWDPATSRGRARLSDGQAPAAAAAVAAAASASCRLFAPGGT